MKKFRHFIESLDDELFVEEIEAVDEETTHFTFDDERSADKLVAKLKRRGIKAKRNGGGGKTHTVTVYSKNKGHHKVAKSSVQKRTDVESKLGESFNEAAAPRWKKAGPNGEIEITIKGKKYKIEKALDHNERHRGEFKIMVWDKRKEEWMWDNTVQGKAYAKELVMDKLDESMQEGSESWEAGYKRRVVKTTKPEHKEKGYNWRIKGKDRPEISIKLYKSKPDFAEFKKQMRRVAGHEFGG